MSGADLYGTVERAVLSRIKCKVDMDSNLKHALLHSDNGKARVRRMVETMTMKIKSEPGWVFIDKNQLELMVWSFTDWFIHAFKRVADEQAKSDLEKIRIKAEAEKFKGLDEFGNGVVEELDGVKVVDSGSQS